MTAPNKASGACPLQELYVTSAAPRVGLSGDMSCTMSASNSLAPGAGIIMGERMGQGGGRETQNQHAQCAASLRESACRVRLRLLHCCLRLLHCCLRLLHCCL